MMTAILRYDLWSHITWFVLEQCRYILRGTLRGSEDKEDVGIFAFEDLADFWFGFALKTVGFCWFWYLVRFAGFCHCSLCQQWWRFFGLQRKILRSSKNGNQKVISECDIPFKEKSPTKSLYRAICFKRYITKGLLSRFTHKGAF